MQRVVSVYDSDSEVDTLDLEEWSYEELNVPAYPEMRVFRNVGKRVCSLAGNPALMALIVEGKWTWFRQRRMSAYTCAMLQR